jgi:type IV secretion system protein VirB9
MQINRILLNLAILLSFLMSSISIADEPITTDNRVKTYVYNENEVYPLVIFYGYQTSIEFAKGEELSTISIGDSYSWSINPIGNRIFVKPLEENMHTNMTILTNKRAYQFDLFSKKADGDFDNELVYVMRFYYPEKENKGVVEAISTEDTQTLMNGS